MLELWQTEWCPALRRVRQRLTELAADHLAELPEAAAHRLKAAKARRRYLEEECECSRALTP